MEFADRSRLASLAEELCTTITRLADSYGAGSVIKEGVNVVIAGIPNAGKSTLLNNLLGDDKAIVSDIAGRATTSLSASASAEPVSGWQRLR